MAIITGPSGAIEVRIQKPPFKAVKPVFFDEYAKLGVRDEKMECTRCLIPENTPYAIYVVVKAPFKFEKWLGLRIKLIDEATNREIFSEKYEKDCKGKKDQIIQIEKVSEGKNEAQFSMNALLSDEKLVNGTGVYGDSPNDRKGLRVMIYKIGEEKADQEWGNNNAHVGARYTGEKKSAVTDGTRAAGGLPTRTRLFLCEKMIFRFTCNSADFLEHNEIVRTPIPNELQPWDFLNKSEKERAFNTLRCYDMERLVKLWKSANVASNLSLKGMEREVRKEYSVSHRAMSMLYEYERGHVFKTFQLRRKYWERGEIPPKELMAPISEVNSLFEEKVAAPQAPVKTLPARVSIAADHNAQTPHREVIVIVDSDSTALGAKRLADSPNIAKQDTMKLEPNGSRSGLVRANPIEQEEPLTKRAKPNPRPVDSKLLRLREEDEREEEELLAAQRVAELIRKRNERKVKMTEIEARSSPS